MVNNERKSGMYLKIASKNRLCILILFLVPSCEYHPWTSGPLRPWRDVPVPRVLRSSRAVMVSHGQFTDRSDSIEQGKPNLLVTQLSVIPFICLLYYLFLAGLSHLVADWRELYYAIYSEMHKIEIRVNQPLYRGFGNSFLQSQKTGFATGFDMFFRPGIQNHRAIWWPITLEIY